MLSIQLIYTNLETLKNEISLVDVNKPSLVQIFTANLVPGEAIELAKQIKMMLPKACIIGSSVNAIIHCGQQYENSTLITIEQFNYSHIEVQMISIENQNYEDITQILNNYWNRFNPTILRMFIGDYYEYAHQLVNEINLKMPNIKLVGGISGELYSLDYAPYVFDHQCAHANALVCAGIKGDELKVYGKINTAHETISPIYTITGVDGKMITEIESQDAQIWLQKNIGFLSTKQYNSWADIAKNDPLVRFQLALENHKSASRFVRYDEKKGKISQYFSRLAQGDQFRLSYTSPLKCVEECRQTALEIQSKPIEQLFVYSCLFRKLYMNNCAQWELTPYHNNNISGVFLLGEFGYNEDGNQLLNGSCVLSGIAENETYLDVDMSMLVQLESLHSESEGLMDFIIKRQNSSINSSHSNLLIDMKDIESKYQANVYTDLNLSMPNLLQYEKDRIHSHFKKLCMLKIDNAESLISYLGQEAYYRDFNNLMQSSHSSMLNLDGFAALKIYAINYNTLIFCSDDSLNNERFTELMLHVEQAYQRCSQVLNEIPYLMRMVVVFDDTNFLEQAYSQMEDSNGSQLKFIVSTEDLKGRTDKELKVVNMIKEAIVKNRVVPYYQGIYNNRIKKIDKYEALIRIKDKNNEIVSPYVFLDVAKKYRLYSDLNILMIKQALHDFNQLDLEVNINLSANDLQSPQLINVLFSELDKFHKPSNITIELLEDECFLQMDKLNQFIQEVRNYGVKIAIDDFGSGYSNLLEIAKIRPDYIKIDGSIVRMMPSQFESDAIVEVIASLGRKLSIELVAEYVENAEVQEKVTHYGITHSQGYYFSEPQSFETILKNEKDKII